MKLLEPQKNGVRERRPALAWLRPLSGSPPPRSCGSAFAGPHTPHAVKQDAGGRAPDLPLALLAVGLRADLFFPLPQSLNIWEAESGWVQSFSWVLCLRGLGTEEPFLPSEAWSPADPSLLLQRGDL